MRVKGHKFHLLTKFSFHPQIHSRSIMDSDHKWHTNKLIMISPSFSPVVKKFFCDNFSFFLLLSSLLFYCGDENHQKIIRTRHHLSLQA